MDSSYSPYKYNGGLYPLVSLLIVMSLDVESVQSIGLECVEQWNSQIM